MTEQPPMSHFKYNIPNESPTIPEHYERVKTLDIYFQTLREQNIHEDFPLNSTLMGLSKRTSLEEYEATQKSDITNAAQCVHTHVLLDGAVYRTEEKGRSHWSIDSRGEVYIIIDHHPEDHAGSRKDTPSTMGQMLRMIHLYRYNENYSFQLYAMFCMGETRVVVVDTDLDNLIPWVMLRFPHIFTTGNQASLVHTFFTRMVKLLDVIDIEGGFGDRVYTELHQTNLQTNEMFNQISKFLAEYSFATTKAFNNGITEHEKRNMLYEAFTRFEKRFLQLYFLVCTVAQRHKKQHAGKDFLNFESQFEFFVKEVLTSLQVNGTTDGRDTFFESIINDEYDPQLVPDSMSFDSSNRTVALNDGGCDLSVRIIAEVDITNRMLLGRHDMVLFEKKPGEFYTFAIKESALNRLKKLGYSFPNFKEATGFMGSDLTGGVHFTGTDVPAFEILDRVVQYFNGLADNKKNENSVVRENFHTYQSPVHNIAA